MIDIENWMQEYQKIIVNNFGNRVLFIGFQGSYARKEPTERSDIDVVLILDKVNIDDLMIYKNIVEKLPHRELLCGFVSGRDEIACWSKYDLFQFYFDTIAVIGNLETIIPELTVEDAKQAVLVGACNIYHACIHNFLHTTDVDTLQLLYKSAFFVMQANQYCKTGIYVRSRSTMQEFIEEKDKPVFQVLTNQLSINQDNFQRCSEILLEWSGNLIRQYGRNEHNLSELSLIVNKG